MSYDDFLLRKQEDAPTDPVKLAAGLRRALSIIGSYELDCRNLAEYVKRNPTGQGFCQGEVYREAVTDVMRAAGWE